MSGAVKTVLATIAGVLLTLGVVVYTSGGSGDGLFGALGDRGTTTTTSSGASGSDPASAPAVADPHDQAAAAPAFADPHDQAAATPWSDAVPPHVLETLALIDTGDWPDAADAPGTRGGERFGNREGLLPQASGDGSRLDYREWDVNPKGRGMGRDAQRIVTGSDGSAWYTADHYASFTQIR